MKISCILCCKDMVISNDLLLMVTIRQVDNQNDSTFKTGFIGNVCSMALVGENVTICFLPNSEDVYAQSVLEKYTKTVLLSRSFFYLMFIEFLFYE